MFSFFILVKQHCKYWTKNRVSFFISDNIILSQNLCVWCEVVTISIFWLILVNRNSSLFKSKKDQRVCLAFFLQFLHFFVQLNIYVYCIPKHPCTGSLSWQNKKQQKRRIVNSKQQKMKTWTIPFGLRFNNLQSWLYNSIKIKNFNVPTKKSSK